MRHLCFITLLSLFPLCTSAYIVSVVLSSDFLIIHSAVSSHTLLYPRNMLYVLRSIFVIFLENLIVYYNVCMCACMDQRQLRGAGLSFHLYVDSEDRTQVVQLKWQILLFLELSCWLPGIAQTDPKFMNPALTLQHILLARKYHHILLLNFLQKKVLFVFVFYCSKNISYMRSQQIYKCMKL